MGIYSALGTAVTGLRAQSYALENISGNIANSQTIGFKRVETSFVDLVPDQPQARQLAGSVTTESRQTNDLQGDVQLSRSPTHMAITGDGYFVVGRSIGQGDGGPLFDGVSLYTRRGDFEVDRNGYLVNGSGYYLKGLPVDPITQNPAGSVPDVVQISNALLAARETTTINYEVNVPQYPRTAKADTTDVGSELIAQNATELTTLYGVDPRASGAGIVRASAETSFLDRSVDGGSITVYSPTGQQMNMRFRWAKIDSVTNDQTTSTHTDTWNLFYQNDSTATGTDTKWTNIGTNYIFGNDGYLSPAVTSVSLNNLTLDGVVVGNVVLEHGTGSLTQFADANGQAQVTKLNQDGYPSGEVTGIAITESGRVRASYNNGQTLDLALIQLADFSADNKLKRLDGGTYEETLESGAPVLGGTGRIIGGSLESSNTDIADEFTKLIVTQQAYAANTRIVSTSDEMLKEALNMIR